MWETKFHTHVKQKIGESSVYGYTGSGGKPDVYTIYYFTIYY
jgi:hypothetical protein